LSSKNDVVFVFQSKPPDSTGPPMRGLAGDAMKEFAVGLEDVAKWFEGFDIDSVVFSISAGLETGGLTKLFISAKGEGGLTVTLKPKKQTA
jgi:hypothetical protein